MQVPQSPQSCAMSMVGSARCSNEAGHGRASSAITDAPRTDHKAGDHANNAAMGIRSPRSERDSKKDKSARCPERCRVPGMGAGLHQLPEHRGAQASDRPRLRLRRRRGKLARNSRRSGGQAAPTGRRQPAGPHAFFCSRFAAFFSRRRMLSARRCLAWIFLRRESDILGMKDCPPLSAYRRVHAEDRGSKRGGPGKPAIPPTTAAGRPSARWRVVGCGGPRRPAAREWAGARRAARRSRRRGRAWARDARP